MNIVVCIKQVPYPDTPASAYSIDPAAKKISLPPDTPLVISPFDENAVETAIQLKKQTGGNVTVICLATNSEKEAIRDLRHTLAMGADEAILLNDPAFDGGDSHATAHALAAAIKKIESYDIILCGRQAADWDAGQVSLGVAEILGIPAAMPAIKVESKENCVHVNRIIDGGYETLEMPCPSLVAISNDEGNVPRIAPLPGVMKASKKKIPIWSAEEIGVDADRIGAAGSRTVIEKLAIPEFGGDCEFIDGEDLADAAAKLADRLREEKII